MHANAKLNLTLDITGVREDGYHLLDSVMHSVNLYDEVTVTRAREFSLSSNSRYMPTDARNVAYKAAAALAAYCKTDLFGAQIHIKKNIPTQAGLGGGSADAAAVLTGLNIMYKLGLSREQLAQIGLSAGADVPFCVYGGNARVGGIGERVLPLSPLSRGCFVIAMPRYGSSTKEAFARYDSGEISLTHPDAAAAAAAAEKNDVFALANCVGNVFEQLGVGKSTEDIKKLLLAHGALGAGLTGSGAAVFGIFRSVPAAKKCRAEIAARMSRCFVAVPCNTGVRMI